MFSAGGGTTVLFTFRMCWCRVKAVHMEDISGLQSRLATVTRELREERGRLASMERFEAISSLQPTPKSSMTKQATRQNVPLEFFDPMVRARDSLRAARTATSELEREKAAAAETLDRANAHLDAARGRTATAAHVTQWGTEKARHFRSPIDRQCAVAALRDTIAQMRSQELCLAGEHRRVGSFLETATEQLLESDELDWELYKMKNEVKIQQAQLTAVQDEIVSVERIFSKKQELLRRTLLRTPHDAVLALEAAKEVEQAKLQRHQSASRDSAVSTRHRAVGVMQREEKLQFYGSSIREVLEAELQLQGDDGSDQLPDAEQLVEADAVDSIRTAIATSRKKEAQLQAHLEFLDAQVGNLESRVDILIRASMSLDTEEERQQSSHKRRVTEVQTAFERQSAAADELIDAQRAGVDSKSSRVKSLRASQGSARSPSQS